jgi:hypothetical protein
MLEEEVSEINPHSRQAPQGIKSQLKSPPENKFSSDRLLVSDAIQWSALITTIHPHNSINYTPPAIPYSHQNLMLPEASLRRSAMATGRAAIACA